MNMKIYIAPSRQKSSEALYIVAKQGWTGASEPCHKFKQFEQLSLVPELRDDCHQYWLFDFAVSYVLYEVQYRNPLCLLILFLGVLQQAY